MTSNVPVASEASALSMRHRRCEQRDLELQRTGGVPVVTAPKRPTLDWGTLYSFSITVNKAPASGSSSLHVATAGTPSDLWIVEPNGIGNDRTPTIRPCAAVDEAATMILCADKTGMLTRNEPTVTTVRPMLDFDAAHVLALAALASSDGEQDPVDAAIRAAASGKETTDAPAPARFMPVCRRWSRSTSSCGFPACLRHTCGCSAYAR
jgi:hypothetical protein